MMKRILVVDIPTDATAEQAEALLNAPYADGYSLDQSLWSGPGIGARVIFRLRASLVKGDSKSWCRVRAGDEDGRGAEAVQVIKENPDLSHAKVAAKLRGLGIQRSRTWVGNKRFDIFGEGTKAE